MMDEQSWKDGMEAILLDRGTKLQWVEKDEWINVSDLPLQMVSGLRELPYYAACHIVVCYLEDLDTPVNDGHA